MINHTLSSTASRSYWLGRYLERAESTARLVKVNSQLLYDLPKRLPQGWQGLLDITASREVFDALYTETNEKNVARFLINDARNDGSLLSSLNHARENARTLRGIIPRQCVEYVNELYLYAKEHLSEPLSRSRRAQGLSTVPEIVQRIDGFMSANMLHDAHWTFLRIGSFIERADMTSRILDSGCDDLYKPATELEPFFDIQWRSVLLSLDAAQSYNRIMQQPVSQSTVLDFLLHNSQLPRSLTYPLKSIRNSVRSLPRHEPVLRLINRLRRFVTGTDLDTLNTEQIRQFLDDFQVQLAAIDKSMSKTYFVFNPRRGKRIHQANAQ